VRNEKSYKFHESSQGTPFQAASDSFRGGGPRFEMRGGVNGRPFYILPLGIVRIVLLKGF